MKYLMLICLSLLFFSCTEELLTDTQDEPCPEMVCTQEFRSVTIVFKDVAGKPVAVKDFTSVIRRTNKTPKSGAVDLVNLKGNYAVVTDSDTKNLLTAGDTIDVSAVNPETNQKKTVQFVVKGGKCACHIDKVSGPEEVLFD